MNRFLIALTVLLLLATGIWLPFAFRDAILLQARIDAAQRAR